MNKKDQKATAEAAARMTAGAKGGGPIGSEQVREASTVLNKYKDGKKQLEERVKAANQWYRLRHWEVVEDNGKGTVQPASGWLFNAIANKHAAAMDNFPRPTVLPREEGDREEAKKLTSILPVVLDGTQFEEVYDKVTDDKIKSGTGIYGIFWDPGKGGMGDVLIKDIDIMSIFWEPGITDLQDSRNVFVCSLDDPDLLRQKYPQLGEDIGGSSLQLTEYDHDDQPDKKEKVMVVDWYYKKWQQGTDGGTGRMLLHYCKYVGDKVLFATENEPEFAERGWYDHGKYPFEVDVMYRMKGELAGFGLVDVAKSTQEYIDRGNQAVMQNMLANARPRAFIRKDGSVNEEEYADTTRELVHYEGDSASIIPMKGNVLPSIYLSVLDRKVDELKETTGNRDINTGGSTSGVTAASAIAAMQEAGSRLDRQANRTSYRAFRRVCLQVIELIRQFYTVERSFRITGENGQTEFTQFSNAGIAPQMQTVAGEDIGYTMPLFDLEIGAEKHSPYSRMAQNELALQFLSAGFFDPQRADQALMCLEMMDFDRKDSLIQKITQQRDRMMMGMSAGGGAPMVPEGGAALGGGAGESAVTANARARVAEASAPG